MKTVLSTKKLKVNQQELLLNAGLSFVAYNAITIEMMPVKMDISVKNAIFTSQNAVRSILRCDLAIERCFCVGDKTKVLLEQNGYKVIEMERNSFELGQLIVKNYKNEAFYYFCGSIRRDELPAVLKTSEIEIVETKTYKTILNTKKFEQKWDGILFFSPSGVKSYFEANSDTKKKGDSHETVLICIGETTASEAKKYSANVVIANATSVESVIAKAVKILRN